MGIPGSVESDLLVSRLLGPSGPRAAAVWRGYRVRRAFARHELQANLKLRHDLFLLISDTEQKARSCRGRDLKRTSSWIEVLYTELARLQGEVLRELADVLKSKVPFFGGGCSPISWRGWFQDLRRMPGLANVQCEGSTLPEEAMLPEESTLPEESSLFACTTLQLCSPPTSPTVPHFESNAGSPRTSVTNNALPNQPYSALEVNVASAVAPTEGCVQPEVAVSAENVHLHVGSNRFLVGFAEPQLGSQPSQASASETYPPSVAPTRLRRFVRCDETGKPIE